MKKQSLFVMMAIVGCGPGINKDGQAAKAQLEDIGFTKVVITDDSDYTSCPLDFKPGVDFSALDRNGTPVTGVVCCTPDNKCNVRWSY